MLAIRKFANTGPVPKLAKNDLHLVCGSGGSRAILASAGTIYALDRAGYKNWQTIGGISGGSIPTVMLAAGVPVGEMVKMAVGMDFSGMLDRRTNIFMTMLAFLMKERLEQTRPRQAALGSERFGAFVDEKVSSAMRSLGNTGPDFWPDKYWTMAVAGKTQVIFTKKGVFQFLHDGTMRQLSEKPAPLGLAVRASCAIPGIIEPPVWNDIYLFDGALSWDGQCPIGVVVRDFGAKPNHIIACDVGDRTTGGLSEFLNDFWRMFCGRSCVWPEDERDPAIWANQGSFVVTPKVNKFSSLQFSLEADQKWDAVMTGYSATITKLWQTGVISHDRFLELAEAAISVANFKEDCGEHCRDL